MSITRELLVPDIGDFTDVPIIEVFVKAGDSVKKDAPVITMESDKATLDVPSTLEGKISEVKVKPGDRVSRGTLLALVEVANDAAGSNGPAGTAGASGSNGNSGAPVTEAGGPVGASAAAADASSQRGSSNQGASANQAPSIIEITVPDIGDFKDVPIIDVFIKAGEAIAKDATVVTLESEKSTLDVPASAAGTIQDVRVKVGDRVSTGTVLGTMSVAGSASKAASGTAVDTQGAQSSQDAASSPSASRSGMAAAGSSAGSGSGISREISQIERPSSYGASGGMLPSGMSNGAGNGSLQNGSTNGTAANGSRGGVQLAPVHASPSIRRFARELGVELQYVSGTGPNGRIRREDVQGWVKNALSTGGSVVNAPSPGGGLLAGLQLPAWPKVDFASFGPVERVQMSRIKRISGPALHRNWVMIPHVTQHDDADITELEAFRKSLNAEQKDARITMLAFLMKAVIASLKKYPDFNSSLDGEELVRKQYYNVGFAADTPNGLVVPVIRDVDKKGVLEIAAETAELAKKARDGKLGGSEMQGGTFTISSLGGIGGTYFTPIVNAPEVAILGVCKAQMKPVWQDGAFVPRLMLPLSLSYDHRVVDGASAARFCVTLAQTLGDLRRVLL